MLKIKNLADAFEIYIIGDIEDDRWKGLYKDFDIEDMSTYPSDIREMLADAKGKEVTVYINSGGGDVFAGVAIASMLKRHDAKVIGKVDGLAASAATFPLFACDEIHVPENAYLMVHKPSSGTWGNATDLRKLADTLDVIQDGMLETYKVHSKEGVDDAILNALIDEETWMTGKDAIDYFDIQVEKPLKMVASAGDRARDIQERFIKDIQILDEIKDEEAEAEKIRKRQLIELALI